MSRSVSDQWPILQTYSRPEWIPEIASFLDVCQIGHEIDSFYVKLRTRSPTSHAVKKFLIELRWDCLHRFGGRSVDFCIGIFPERHTSALWFTIVFAPIALVQSRKNASGEKISYNPDTKATNVEYGTPFLSLDAASVKGVALLSHAHQMPLVMPGRRVLCRLWDFTRYLLCVLFVCLSVYLFVCLLAYLSLLILPSLGLFFLNTPFHRKPQSRVFIRKRLLDLFGYMDRAGQANFPLVAHVRDVKQEPVFSPLLSQTDSVFSSLDVDDFSFSSHNDESSKGRNVSRSE